MFAGIAQQVLQGSSPAHRGAFCPPPPPPRPTSRNFTALPKPEPLAACWVRQHRHLLAVLPRVAA